MRTIPSTACSTRSTDIDSAVGTDTPPAPRYRSSNNGRRLRLLGLSSIPLALSFSLVTRAGSGRIGCRRGHRQHGQLAWAWTSGRHALVGRHRVEHIAKRHGLEPRQRCQERGRLLQDGPTGP